jgi:hypothetical protein
MYTPIRIVDYYICNSIILDLTNRLPEKPEKRFPQKAQFPRLPPKICDNPVGIARSAHIDMK